MEILRTDQAVIKKETFKVSSPDNGLRLDQFIRKYLSSHSRTFLQCLIQDGHVRINEVVILKASHQVVDGDRIVCSFPMVSYPPKRIDGALPAIQAIFQHEHFLVINKPASCMVHAPHPTSPEITVVDWLLEHYREVGEVGLPERPGIVHRLDSDTSGVLIIARTNYAHMALGNMFKQRTIRKVYTALVEGHPPARGTIDLAIGRDPIVKVKMKAFQIKNPNASIREAVSHFNVIEYLDNAAIVVVYPVTGRTHQIRVHMAAIGHPILGDTTYGSQSSYIARHALHAMHLSFVFDKESYHFDVPFPDDMQKAIEKLRLTQKSAEE